MGRGLSCRAIARQDDRSDERTRAQTRAEVRVWTPGAEVALLAKSYRLAVATVGAAWLSPISATTTPTT